MSRQKMVVGNWKMNKVYVEGLVLANTVMAQLQQFREDVKVVVCPPSIHIQTIASIYRDYPQLSVGAQNCSHHASGAYTGELSAAMLASVGAEYVILGHSERRTHFNETHQELAEKVEQALQNKLSPIFCCGEPFDKREANQQEAFVQQQIEESLFHLAPKRFEQLIIAYEPIWAIGTGMTATPEQAQEMHAFIRQLIASKYGDDIAENTTILYGGSCKPSNAAELFAQKDVDGALVGGASLHAEDFVQIVLQRV
jgi:triosephosphate isomerase